MEEEKVAPKNDAVNLMQTDDKKGEQPLIKTLNEQTPTAATINNSSSESDEDSSDTAGEIYKDKCRIKRDGC